METIKCTKCQQKRIILNSAGICTTCIEENICPQCCQPKEPENEGNQLCKKCETKNWTAWITQPVQPMKYKTPDPVPAKELKPSGRGGKRPGAGRRALELHQEADRKVTKSITLSASTWEYLADHSTDSLSKAIEALIQLHGQPNGTGAEGWSETRRSQFDSEEKFNEYIKKAKAHMKQSNYEEATAPDPRIKE